MYDIADMIKLIISTIVGLLGVIFQWISELLFGVAENIMGE